MLSLAQAASMSPVASIATIDVQSKSRTQDVIMTSGHYRSNESSLHPLALDKAHRTFLVMLPAQ